MHISALLIAAISTTMVAANPLLRRSDYITCLQICSENNSQCTGAATGNTVEVAGVDFNCNLQGLTCEFIVCEGTQNVETVTNGGLPAVAGIFAALGKNA